MMDLSTEGRMLTAPLLSFNSQIGSTRQLQHQMLQQQYQSMQPSGQQQSMSLCHQSLSAMFPQQLQFQPLDALTFPPQLSHPSRPKAIPLGPLMPLKQIGTYFLQHQPATYVILQDRLCPQVTQESIASFIPQSTTTIGLQTNGIDLLDLTKSSRGDHFMNVQQSSGIKKEDGAPITSSLHRQGTKRAAPESNQQLSSSPTAASGDEEIAIDNDAAPVSKADRRRKNNCLAQRKLRARQQTILTEAMEENQRLKDRIVELERIVEAMKANGSHQQHQEKL